PSGPIGVPLVGYLPFLGRQPHRDIAKLSEKYGNVFTLQLGVHNIVILNDWEAVKDAFQKDAFLDRPKDSAFVIADVDSIINCKGFGDDNGLLWREHRRFALQAMRDLGFGKGSMEDRIGDEITHFTKLIDETDGQGFNFHKILTPSMSNNICHLVFGHRMDFNDPKRIIFDNMLDTLASQFSMLGVFKEIESHQKTLDPNNNRDYIDGFLNEMKIRQQRDPNTSFTINKLAANSRAFFGAGSETVRTTVEWLVLLAVKHKDIQKRLHEEIDDVIGRDRSPTWADRLDMPYTQAVINEVFRWKTIAPLNLMRSASEDAYILGHFIPKNTRIMANIWAVHYDPKVWNNPDQFNPNRFLTPDAKQLIKTEALIPFSYGKRNCVGETLARVEVFLYFVSLLQRYTISAENEEMLSLDDKFGLTLQPKESQCNLKISFTSLFILLYYLSDKHIFSTYKERLSLPSGPIGVPLVGYLPFLGREPHKDIAKLSDKYGGVFTLQLGVHNTVIVNDWESAKDALLKDSFLDRPKNGPFTLADNSSSLVDDSGQEWRDHRRFALQTLRDLGFGKGSMEDRIGDEISYLIKLIDETDGQGFNFHKLLVPSMSNNISHLVFGHRMDFNDPKRIIFDDLLDTAGPLFSLLGLFAVSPVWFSKIILKVGAIGMSKKFETVINIFNKEIESHQKTMDPNNNRDYMDGFLNEMQKRQHTDPNSIKKLSTNSRTFFGAGSETVRTTVEWLVLLAVKHKDIQKRLHEEIDDVIGRDRSPTWADRLDMPYSQAFINEVFRWKNILPLNLVRSASEDSYILGHFIPKDTRILINLWAVHHDHKVWQKPEQFNPNRFITSDGKNLIKTEALIPFTLGKRNCVGETLARVEVFLYFVSLLQRYTISAENEERFTLEDKFGLTLQPKESFILRFQKRF
ncbi:unnamed protein product, partial [Medioppia subpectinata]